jgi:hypothetical protein
LNYYEKVGNRPLTSDDVAGFQGFLGFGIEDGECCEPCVCDDDCGEDIEFICTYCPALTTAPSSLTSYRYYNGGIDCPNCACRWNIPSLWSREFPQGTQIYARSLEVWEWKTNFTSTAYETDLYYDNREGKFFTLVGEELDGTPKDLVTCGTSMVSYRGRSINPFTGAKSEYRYTAELSAGTPIDYQARTCNRQTARWTGPGGVFSWAVGDPSEGGWDKGGYGNWLSAWHGGTSRVQCPPDGEEECENTCSDAET